jgi:putative RNA 2'-phosphotransferase
VLFQQQWKRPDDQRTKEGFSRFEKSRYNALYRNFFSFSFSCKEKNFMNNKQFSKFLSLILRHRPEVIGIALDENGWANVEELLDNIKQSGKDVDLEQLKEVVASNDKQRFTFDEKYQMIRANQGHSIPVKLEMPAIQPPSILYHGTAKKNIPSILEKGILKGSRQHVHLSSDQDTAVKVGQRYGKPVVLKIKTGKMYAEGCLFFLSKNGVWLTDFVPSKYIQQ